MSYGPSPRRPSQRPACFPGQPRRASARAGTCAWPKSCAAPQRPRPSIRKHTHAHTTTTTTHHQLGAHAKSTVPSPANAPRCLRIGSSPCCSLPNTQSLATARIISKTKGTRARCALGASARLLATAADHRPGHGGGGGGGDARRGGAGGGRQTDQHDIVQSVVRRCRKKEKATAKSLGDPFLIKIAADVADVSAPPVIGLLLHARRRLPVRAVLVRLSCVLPLCANAGNAL